MKRKYTSIPLGGDSLHSLFKKGNQDCRYSNRDINLANIVISCKKVANSWRGEGDKKGETALNGWWWVLNWQALSWTADHSDFSLQDTAKALQDPPWKTRLSQKSVCVGALTQSQLEKKRSQWSLTYQSPVLLLHRLPLIFISKWLLMADPITQQNWQWNLTNDG